VKPARQKKRKKRRNFTVADVDREARQRKAWLKEAGLIGGVRSRREAAYEALEEKEFFQDLARRAAKRIAGKRKRWKPRRAAGNHYSQIAVMLYGLPWQEIRKLRSSLNDLVREFVLAFLDDDHDRFKLSSELLLMLTKEWVRDRTTLCWFLSAVAKRKREHERPSSLLRVRTVIQQLGEGHGHSRRRILKRLQRCGAVPKKLTTAQENSWLKKIGQCLSRDQTTALQNERRQLTERLAQEYDHPQVGPSDHTLETAQPEVIERILGGLQNAGLLVRNLKHEEKKKWLSTIEKWIEEWKRKKKR
jgi:hypothetical protein